MPSNESRRQFFAEILSPLSSLLPESFQESIAALPDDIPDELLRFWLESGIGLGDHSSAGRELTAAYFRSGLILLSQLDEPTLRLWIQAGRGLTGTGARAYFRAGPAVVPKLTGDEVERWARLGQSLYPTSSKSHSLSARFFDVSALVVDSLSFGTLELLGQIIELVARHSVDHAATCLEAAPAIIESLRGDCSPFFELGLVISQGYWMEAVPYFQNGPGPLENVEPFQRAHYLSLMKSAALRLSHGRAYRPFLDCAQAFRGVPTARHGRIIELAEQVLPFSAMAAISFLRNTPLLTTRLRMNELELWHAAGIDAFLETGSGGEAYFSLELGRAQEMLRKVAARVELGDVVHVLGLYGKALTGANVAVKAAADLETKGIGWVSEAAATSDGTSIFLPEYVDEFDTKADNFSVFKAYATHQAGHLEFGSFRFGFDSEQGALPSRRGAVEAERRGGATGDQLTDMERFFDLFPDRLLGADLFTIAEDMRTDCMVQQEYPGLRTIHRRLKELELGRRPNTFFLALRQAFVENLLRSSLGGKTSVGWPKPLAHLLLDAIRVLENMRNPAATVEDAAEAALLLYDLAERVPNLPPGEGGFLDWMSVAELEEGGTLTRDPATGMSGREVPYESLGVVGFYGDFKPEIVQLLLRVRGQGSEKPSLDEDEARRIRAMLEKSAEVDLHDGQDLATLVENLGREAKVEESAPEAPAGISPPLSGQRHALGVKISHYHEWDFRSAGYRPRWCTVVEHEIDEGEDDFFDKTLTQRAELVRKTQRYFELMKPEPFRKVKRLEDGEDVDIDAAIDFLVQKKAGHGEIPKIYWRRNKAEREVAVAFLIDMSSSTDARIDKQSWPPKRIIDLEKESIVLLVAALETIGDRYGVYGFSGSGRHNVEYFVIKDFADRLGAPVRRRIDGIAPVDATRMGAAVRHTIAKLRTVEARTRILFLLSDGRPQDVDYGPEPGDREYAIHDTHMALLEARQAGITPFALTVDKDGHDYLGQMCGSLAYEVLDDIEMLPSRLPTLYRMLTG